MPIMQGKFRNEIVRPSIVSGILCGGRQTLSTYPDSPVCPPHKEFLLPYCWGSRHFASKACPARVTSLQRRQPLLSTDCKHPVWTADPISTVKSAVTPVYGFILWQRSCGWVYHTLGPVGKQCLLKSKRVIHIWDHGMCKLFVWNVDGHEVFTPNEMLCACVVEQLLLDLTPPSSAIVLLSSLS